MPSKKPTKKKKKSPKPAVKTASKKSKRTAPKKIAAKKPVKKTAKTIAKKIAARKPAPKKPASNKFAQKKAAPPKSKKTSGEKPSRRDRSDAANLVRPKKGPGPGSAGQSGDLQGLENDESVGTESVEELAEEGQGFEAAFVEGVENAADPDEAEVTTHEEPEDDVPSEYLENE
jgi:hypothetical protein